MQPSSSPQPLISRQPTKLDSAPADAAQVSCRHAWMRSASPAPCRQPSTLEQRTGRVDRINAKAERVKKSIHVYLPYLAGTQDEKMFRVVRDRERWFQVIMGEEYRVDEVWAEGIAQRVPLPEAAARELAFRLQVWEGPG